VSEEKDVLVELLTGMLGDYKQHYESKCQISFNCPYCDEGRNKGNLEVNYEKGVYKCWSCSEENDTHGALGKLFDEFGNKKQKKIYELLRPEKNTEKEKARINRLKLPEGYTKFKDSNPIYPVYKQAISYLRERGITDEIIEKYDIGFCDKGDHSGRIIIPSYDLQGKLNYFISRSWNKYTKSKYKNPDSPKDEIIFNESRVNWEKDVYLCEGVFDGLFLSNFIPMLGKHCSDLLFENLYLKAKGDIHIVLDGDAWKQSLELYHRLNGGDLYGRVKVYHLPIESDCADLRGNISEYEVKIN
jgi:DNA primase